MIKKGMNVKVLTGKDKNKTGEIIEVDKKKLRAKVKDVNMVKKHIKTTKEKKGGIVSKENFLDISNLSIIKIEPSRINLIKLPIVKKMTLMNS